MSYNTNLYEKAPLKHRCFSGAYLRFSKGTTQMMLLYCYQDFLVKNSRIFAPEVTLFLLKAVMRGLHKALVFKPLFRFLAIKKRLHTKSLLEVWRPLLYQLSYTPMCIGLDEEVKRKTQVRFHMCRITKYRYIILDCVTVKVMVK